MVRLVFRPYTRVGRSICTSESLRTSTRVSSGLVLHGHSSPSFGCQRVRSSAAPRSREPPGRAVAALRTDSWLPEIATLVSRFIAPLGFGGPIDSRTCWTPWSVFQDGSGGLPTYSPQTSASKLRDLVYRDGLSVARPGTRPRATRLRGVADGTRAASPVERSIWMTALAFFPRQGDEHRARRAVNTRYTRRYHTTLARRGGPAAASRGTFPVWRDFKVVLVWVTRAGRGVLPAAENAPRAAVS